jgi:replicative DNA helicase
VNDPRAVLGRVPPHAEEAEKSVLGSVLLDDKALPLVRVVLPDSTHFYLDAHRAIYDAMLALANSKMAIDGATLSEALRTAGQLDRCGGPAYLNALIDAAPISSHPEDQAAIIREKGLVRDAILRASRIVSLGFEGADPVTLSSEFSQASSAVLPPSRERTPAEIVRESLAGNPLHAIRFPIRSGAHGSLTDLGDYLGDVFPGQKIVVSARTSEGKTALLRMFWLACAAGAIPSAFLSLEDSEEEIANGAAGAASWLTTAGIIARRWSGAGAREEGELIARWFERLPMSVKHIPGARPAEVAEHVRAMVVRNGAKVVIVDYLQAMAHEGRENRSSQIGTALGEMTRAAGNDAVLVVGSQLARPPKDAKDAEQTIDDQSESKRIEDDAKAVIMLRRVGEESVDERGRPTVRRVNLRVAKNKLGRTGKMDASLWLRHTCLWPGVVRPVFDLESGPRPDSPVPEDPEESSPDGEWVDQETLDDGRGPF